MMKGQMMKGQMADAVCPFPCRVAMPSFNAIFIFPWLPSVVGCDGFLQKKGGGAWWFLACNFGNMVYSMSSYRVFNHNAKETEDEPHYSHVHLKRLRIRHECPYW
jgi:hypothetical protein